MRALTARSALRAWERGQPLDAQGRMLALLTEALPEVDRGRLRELPIGQRDALLVRLRQRTFGHKVRGFAQCSVCQTALEFDLDLRTYQAAEHLKHRLSAEWISADGFDVQFRLPNSADFDAMADTCMDVGSARALLYQRCILQASRDGEAVAAMDLSPAALDRLGDRMEERDPLAELPLAVECERCHHHWLVLFDVGKFLWRDVTQAAHRLLDEVHALATTYGWTEPQIIALSAARRRYYLEKMPTTKRR